MDNKSYTARVLFSSLFFTFFVLTVSAQTTTDTGSNQTASIEELEVKPLRLPALQEVGGSPFMTTDFQSGSVTIAENKIVPNVPVRFNIFSNAVMIQKEGAEMKLENFQSVTYAVTGNDGSVKQVLFRQGYPEVDNHTEKSVYQVLSMGEKVHLLKFLTQKVEDAATLGDYSRRELVTTQQLYIYTPGGEMKKIKTSKQSLVEALPALSTRIEEVVNSQKLNLKNESSITELVNALNKP